MTWTPIAYVVGVGATPGTVRIRCPFCRRIHIHRRPSSDTPEHQPARCGTPAGYRIALPIALQPVAEHPTLCSLCGQNEVGILGVCTECVDSAPWMRMRTNTLPATEAEEEEEENEYRHP